MRLPIVLIITVMANMLIKAAVPKAVSEMCNEVNISQSTNDCVIIINDNSKIIKSSDQYCYQDIVLFVETASIKLAQQKNASNEQVVEAMRGLLGLLNEYTEKYELNIIARKQDIANKLILMGEKNKALDYLLDDIGKSVSLYNGKSLIITMRYKLTLGYYYMNGKSKAKGIEYLKEVLESDFLRDDFPDDLRLEMISLYTSAARKLITDLNGQELRKIALYAFAYIQLKDEFPDKIKMISSYSPGIQEFRNKVEVWLEIHCIQGKEGSELWKAFKLLLDNMKNNTI